MVPDVQKAAQVFTPGWPVNDRDLFRGRVDQIRRVLDAIPSPGRHPVLFGLRGVGKTSLVNLLEIFVPDVTTLRITCDSADTFKSIWNRALSRATVEFKEQAFGFSEEEATKKVCLADFLGKDNDVSPSDVAGILEGVEAGTVFVLDEFDRVCDQPTKTHMADLIKHISDHNPLVTLVLVGVGRSISDLVGEHPSVGRNLVQIEMPKMKPGEIKDVLSAGFQKLGMTAASEVLDEAPHLTDGFPHYAHLLGLACVRACAVRGTNHVTLEVFNGLACEMAVEEAIETYRAAFIKATRTTQQSRFQHILCACSMASHDDEGVFRASDVVEAMKAKIGIDTNLQKIVPALGEFCSSDRGPVLEKVMVRNRAQYRFREPMIRPFLRIRAKSLPVGLC